MTDQSFSDYEKFWKEEEYRNQKLRMVSDIKPGQYWIYRQNPYPLKGFPEKIGLWEIDGIYEVTDYNPMSGKYTAQVAFKGVENVQDKTEWEIGEDTFVLGFEPVVSEKNKIQ